MNLFHRNSLNRPKLLTNYFINTLIVLSFICIHCSYSQDPFCPSVLQKILNNTDDNGKCSRIKCLSSILDKNNCPEGTFHMQNSTMCGCCPGCLEYIKKDVTCSQNPNWDYSTCNEIICPIITNECEPGYKCLNYPATGGDKCQHEMSQECDDDGNNCVPVFVLPLNSPKDECLYKKSLFKNEEYHWDPNCDETGFAPKQCKGNPGTYDGECFCVDGGGKRIFGRQWWAEAENQTCACSRRVSDLRSVGNIATLHCTAEGNYEPVQCDTDSGTCWCVDPKTGKTTGGILPQKQWKSLPCYSVNFTNPETTDRYLRVCDSELAGGRSLEKDAALHGIEKVALKMISCDYDGSFSPRQDDGTTMTCTHKNGDRILDFFKGGKNDMDCNCARDQVYYDAAKRPFPFSGKCEGQSGNYLQVYDFGQYASCIDRDGFSFGKTAPSTHVCCLQYECVTNLMKECIAEGYKACKRDFAYII